MLKVGKKLISKAGNVVQVLERKTIDDKQGRPQFIYKCRVVKTANGHEILKNKIQRFFEDGKWFAFPGGIHDLVKDFEE